MGDVKSVAMVYDHLMLSDILLKWIQLQPLPCHRHIFFNYETIRKTTTQRYLMLMFMRCVVTLFNINMPAPVAAWSEA